MPMRKIKAHKSREAAVLDGECEKAWAGNHLADKACKDLARELSQADDLPTRQASARDGFRKVAMRLAFVMKWVFRARPQSTRSQRQRGQRKAYLGHSLHDGPPHSIVAEPNGRWHCSACRREAWTEENLRRFRQSSCPGPIAGSCHQSHRLVNSRGVLWCQKCGAYTTRQPRALKRVCMGKPASESAANVLARLRRGLLPTTAKYLDRASIGGDKDMGPYLLPARPPNTVENDGADTTRQQESDDWCAPCGEPALYPTLGPRGGSALAVASRRTPYQDTGHLHHSGSRRGAVQLLPVDGPGSAHCASRYRNLDRRRMQENTATEQPAADVQVLPSPAPTRRRIVGKQPPSETSTGLQFRPLDANKSERCWPEANTPWTSRISLERTTTAVPCTLCLRACRGRCTGCNSSLCIDCARARRPCVRSSSSSGHHHVDRVVSSTPPGLRGLVFVEF